MSQPLTAALHNSTNDMDVYKSEKNNLIKQHNERLRQESDYMSTRPSRSDYATVQSLNNDFCRLNVNDSHSNDSSISERINLIGSEEELSTGAGNASPRTRRAAKHAQNYTNRNQSPRSLNGEAKLRPGVTSRSSNRNSANLSNFQEELLRLINPDNIEQTEQKVMKDSKNHSRENLNNALSIHKPQSQPEVILTMARPATVISNASTTSSPLPIEFKRAQDDPHVPLTKMKTTVSFPDEFPLPEDGDWPSLVDTATCFMNQVGSCDGGKEMEVNRCWDGDGVIDASITST